MLAFVLSSVFATIAGIFFVTRLFDGDDQPAALHRAVRGCDLRDRRIVAVRRARLDHRPVVLGACVAFQVVSGRVILAPPAGVYFDMFVGIMIVDRRQSSILMIRRKY